MNIDDLKADLLRDEGMRLKPYLDTVGVETIGVGRNLRDVGITEEEALYLLGNDIAKITARLDAELPWWKSRSEPVQRAMANMCFQLGLNGLLAFKRMLACLQAGDYAGATREALDSAWAKQTPNRAAHVTALFHD